MAVLTIGCGGESAPERAGARERAAAEAPAAAPRPAVLVLGDSLAAGYGLDPRQAFPALLQARIDAAGLDYEVLNRGVSGDTTSGGLGRLDWLLRRPCDLLVLALGGNDGLRGIPVETTEANLRAIIDRFRAARPGARILLAGMMAPPNMGREFTASFQALFPRLAEQNGLPFVPFLLEGVAGIPGLNQADGIHPTAAGQELVAENVWRHLEPLLAAGPHGAVAK